MPGLASQHDGLASATSDARDEPIEGGALLSPAQQLDSGRSCGALALPARFAGSIRLSASRGQGRCWLLTTLAPTMPHRP